MVALFIYRYFNTELIRQVELELVFWKWNWCFVRVYWNWNVMIGV